MRLVSTIIILIAVSIQGSIAQVTYEPDQTTSKSKKKTKDKVKKNIDFGFTIGAKQCIINSIQAGNTFQAYNTYFLNDSTGLPPSGLVKPKPVFNLSNLYFTTSFELNEKNKLYVNLGLQRNVVKMNLSQQESLFLDSVLKIAYFSENGSISFKTVDIALPIIYSYKLNSKINLEFGANSTLTMHGRNTFYPYLGDDVFRAHLFEGLKIHTLGSVCYNFKPNSQIRFLIDTNLFNFSYETRDDFAIIKYGPNLISQSSISRFTYLNINFTQLF